MRASQRRGPFRRNWEDHAKHTELAARGKEESRRRYATGKREGEGVAQRRLAVLGSRGQPGRGGGEAAWPPAAAAEWGRGKERQHVGRSPADVPPATRQRSGPMSPFRTPRGWQRVGGVRTPPPAAPRVESVVGQWAQPR